MARAHRLEHVKMGLAWHDPPLRAEGERVRRGGSGSPEGETGTSDDKPVAPWDWRKQQNNDADEDD